MNLYVLLICEVFENVFVSSFILGIFKLGLISLSINSVGRVIGFILYVLLSKFELLYVLFKVFVVFFL